DEPTSGLDPIMEQAFQQCVRARREDGVTVLLSSHIMGEVEALADRVSIIGRGRTITTGTLAELRRHSRTAVHAVTVEEPGGLAETDGVTDHQSEQLNGQTDSRFTIDPDHLDAVIGRLHAAGIHTLTVTPPSLDALFLQNYQQTLDPDESDADGNLAEAAR
ncbi:MAG: ABC transporter ATP-binding protein, partial [Marmoricola sp.]